MKLEALPDAIIDDFRKYTEDKCEKIDKAVRKRTAEAEEDIRANSPVRKRVPKSGVVMVKGVAKDNYQPGAYKKGWITYISTAREGRTQGYVRNKTNYQITHLLERGHKARNGAPVKAIEHIIPAETQARKNLAEDIDRILSEE